MDKDEHINVVWVRSGCRIWMRGWVGMHLWVVWVDKRVSEMVGTEERPRVL